MILNSYWGDKLKVKLKVKLKLKACITSNTLAIYEFIGIQTLNRGCYLITRIDIVPEVYLYIE